MKFTLIFTLSMIAQTVLYGQATSLFSQDFSSSTNLTDYQSATPNSGQFNQIGVNPTAINPTTMGSISSQKLVLSRPTTGASCGFTRNTDFAFVPNVMIISFKFSVTTSTANTSDPCIFYLGSGLSTNYSIPANANCFARLSVNFTNNNGFQIKNLVTSPATLISDVFTGEQTFYWVLNNSGQDFSYQAPDGSSVTLSNDKVDLWVGNTKVYNSINPQTSTQSLANFKLVYGDGIGDVTLDDLSITGYDVALPLSIVHFEAKKDMLGMLLNWETADGKNNSYFNIEHSRDGSNFETIETIQSTSAQSIYSYRHSTPSVFSNYYRLKQVDFDNRFFYSPIESIETSNNKPSFIQKIDKNQILLKYPNSHKTLKYNLINIIGNIVMHGTANDDMLIDIGHLPRGMYIFKRELGAAKFLKE